MTGIEKITARIQADAQQEIDAVLAEANRQAAEINARYAAQAKQAEAEILEKGRQSAAELRQRRNSSAQMDAKKQELAVKQALLDEAFQLAYEKLTQLRAALEADPRTEFLAVQDGARPLVTPELIDAVVTAAFRSNAAAPAVPVRDTIKRREGDRVTETVNRESLAAVQTPQVFEASLLKAALQSAMEAGAALTDDCSAVERLGKIVYLVEGDPENLKITTPLDLVLAEAILEDRRRRG